MERASGVIQLPPSVGRLLGNLGAKKAQWKRDTGINSSIKETSQDTSQTWLYLRHTILFLIFPFCTTRLLEALILVVITIKMPTFNWNYYPIAWAQPHQH